MTTGEASAVPGRPPKRAKLIDWEREVGKGAYGTVYAAKIDGKDGHVVKSMPLHSLPEAVTEIAILTAIHHPFILHTMYAPDVSNNQIRVVLPRAITDLRKYLQKHSALDRDLLRRWGLQLADALCALHSHDILHGDVKSSNVLVFIDRVQLADFTMSLQKATPSQGFNHRATTITYRAPEALVTDIDRGSGHTWDERADNFALGCILYEMATGKPMFSNQGPNDNHTTQRQRLATYIEFAHRVSDQSSLDKYVAALKDEPVELLHVPDITHVADQEFQDLILALVRLSPSRRFTSAGAVGHPVFSRDVGMVRRSYKFTSLVPAPLSNKLTQMVAAEAFRQNVDVGVATKLLSCLPLDTGLKPRELVTATVRVAGITSGVDLRKPRPRGSAQLLQLLQAVDFRVLRNLHATE